MAYEVRSSDWSSDVCSADLRGVVDVLAEDGRREESLRDYMASSAATPAAHRAIYKARHRVSPITHQELIDITTLWVDTAMGLEDGDLRRMARLVAAQDRRSARAKGPDRTSVV